MKNYLSYKTEYIHPGYRSNFLNSITGSISSEIQPFVWCENKDEIELFISEPNSFISLDLIKFFKNFKKTIWLYLVKPILLENNLFDNDMDFYTKLTYLKWDNFTFTKSFKQKNIILTVEEFNVDLNRQLRTNFINDERLYMYEIKMKPVYCEMLSEFDNMVNKCEHMYILYNNKLIGYISGRPLPADMFGRFFYLIPLIWIEANLNKNVKNEVISLIITWLNKHPTPYYAAINFSNKKSRHFFEINGFSPYIVRFLPWPK